MLKNQYNKRLNNVNIMSLACCCLCSYRRTVFGARERRKKINHIEFIGRDTDPYKRTQQNVDNGWKTHNNNKRRDINNNSVLSHRYIPTWSPIGRMHFQLRSFASHSKFLDFDHLIELKTIFLQRHKKIYI